jgi:hypothetical protein
MVKDVLHKVYTYLTASVVLGHKSRGPGSISGATRFFEK